MRKRISLKQAIEFHGHLGPYLVLGLIMGEYALREINAKPHFGLEVKIWGANQTPKSCLIDGLQLSTGCTYGKGNITKYSGRHIKVHFLNKDIKKSITIKLQAEVLTRLAQANDHSSCEKLARELYKACPEKVFILL